MPLTREQALAAAGVLVLAVTGQPPPPPGGTIAQGAAAAAGGAAGHGGSGSGGPPKVATPLGVKHFNEPIGSLIIAHPHAPSPAAAAEKAEDAAQAAKEPAEQAAYAKEKAASAADKVQDAAAEALYQKEHAAGQAEKAQDAVQAGTHHWVQAGEHAYAVHNGLEVHVPKDTDIHDAAAVKNAPKVARWIRESVIHLQEKQACSLHYKPSPRFFV